MNYCINASNINGLGATILSRDIIKTLISDPNLHSVYVSESLLNSLSPRLRKNKKIIVCSDLFQKNVSRFLMLIFSHFFFPKIPTIVLGDIPMNLNTRQNILIHNPLYAENFHTKPFNFLNSIKQIIFFYCFLTKSKYINRIIVQTNFMRDGLLFNLSRFDLKKKVIVIDNPLCKDFLAKRTLLLKQRAILKPNLKNKKITLFYPSAYYPHKNHTFLKFLDDDKFLDSYINKIILTIDPNLNPAPNSRLVKCVGTIHYNEVLKLYGSIDYILFLSEKESLGLPLIEAQSLGIPIICPNLAYSREVCKATNFFYEHNQIDDFKKVVVNAFQSRSSINIPLNINSNSWSIFCNKLKDFN